MKLKEKVAIVTGGASGMGKATVERFAREGACVVIFDINIEGAKKVAEDINKSGGKVLAQQVDISCLDDVKQMVESTVAEFGKVDILASLAAPSPLIAPFAETDPAQWMKDISIDLLGTMYCTWCVIPHMVRKKSGRIITVTSDGGKNASPYITIYSACKGALYSFSQSIAKELAPYGITVNCVAPGRIDTPMNARHIKEHPEAAQENISRIPMGRVGKPEEVANMILFLASDEASYITGQHYSVNGGLNMID